MAVNAGHISRGEARIEVRGLGVVSTDAFVQVTWAEHRTLHNGLVLFNPAPVT